METIAQPGGHVMVAQAPVWDHATPTLRGRDHLLIGRMPKDILWADAAGLSWALGQLYGVVGPGLITAKYLFEGLRRDMRVGEDGHAASKKLAATWAQGRDARLVGDDPFHMRLEYVPAEPKRVFCVYISRNQMLEEFPDIYGWAEHWTWIAADPVRLGAPVESDKRYDRCLWSA